jgi:uncharacterized cofD-like protein
VSSSVVKWLYFGMHVKRWLGLTVLGVLCVSLGTAYLITHLYRMQPLPEWVYYATLQFIDRPQRGALFIGVGAAVIAVGFVRLNRSLLAPFAPQAGQSLVEALYRHSYLGRGPKIVAIGGGTGLATLCRGLKEHTSNLTAIVTVADDGGSSGRLRRELGVPPPGDFRQCLVALADVEPLMARLFQHRFEGSGSLGGHSFGNLFIVAMSAITGSFEAALRESSRVLAVRGRVLPSTLRNLTLCAEYEESSLVQVGESAIPQAGKAIKRVFLRPSEPPAYPEAMQAILSADVIVIGPGSLFTSVLPNLLVDGIADAIRVSRALKVYVCNVSTEKGETDDFTVADHIGAIERHVGPGLFDVALAHDRSSAPAFGSDAGAVIALDAAGSPERDYRLISADLVDERDPLRHDPSKLARTTLAAYHAGELGSNGRRRSARVRAVTEGVA